VEASPKVLSNEKNVRFCFRSDNGLPVDVHCAMELLYSSCDTFQTRLSFSLFPPEDDFSREFSGRIRMATRMPSSSGALLASLLPLLEALAVVAAADATREADDKDDDIVAKFMTISSG